jgi:hypothetical protein
LPPVMVNTWLLKERLMEESRGTRDRRRSGQLHRSRAGAARPGGLTAHRRPAEAAREILQGGLNSQILVGKFACSPLAGPGPAGYVGRAAASAVWGPLASLG